MIVNIVGGGPQELLPDLNSFECSEEHIWIGVDRGNRYLLDHGLTPDIAIGDFDSISREELESYKTLLKEVRQHVLEKDETDMELALDVALSLHPSKIHIFGATGGRIDHFIANLLLLTKMINQPQIPIEMIDKQNIAKINTAGSYTIKKSEYPYISFIPLSGSVEGLTLDGFKYILTDGHILLGSTLCISNELIQNYGTYSFKKGILLVIRAKDAS